VKETIITLGGEAEDTGVVLAFGCELERILMKCGRGQTGFALLVGTFVIALVLIVCASREDGFQPSSFLMRHENKGIHRWHII